MINFLFYILFDEFFVLVVKKFFFFLIVCIGVFVEMVMLGGEVGFVIRIIEELFVVRERVMWYMVMVGFLLSLMMLVERLKKEGVSNYVVFEFV